MEHQLVERSGKSYCSVCNGVDGLSLASECPGRPLSNAQVGGLYNGELDYRAGEWVNPRAPIEEPAPEPPPPPPPPPPTSYHTNVEVEVESDPDPQVRQNDNDIPIPIPIPVPVPVPTPGGQNTENDPNAADPDPQIDLQVHRR